MEERPALRDEAGQHELPRKADRRVPVAFAVALATFAVAGPSFYSMVKHRVSATALAQPAGALQASMGEWMAALFGGGALAVLVFVLVLAVGRRRR